MRACIELGRDYGWGPTRILVTELRRGGYRVTEARSPRHVLLALSGPGAGEDAALDLLPAATQVPPEGVTAGMPERPYATLPVLPALAALLPGGGLGKGEVVTVDRPGMLSAALAARASQQGMWWGVAGIPEFGVAAAAEMGADPARMMLVPEPGAKWAEVTAAMAGACEVVLLRPGGPVTGAVRRRLETAARKSGAALIVAGPWDGAAARLRVGQQEWEGLGDGYGRLRARRAEVIAEGRGTLARPRRAWLWLPGPDGTVTAAGAPAARRPEATSARIG